jgi:(2Fe-2S) ferredoxin
MCTSSEKKILVCTNLRANPNNPSCGARGSDVILAALRNQNLAIPIEISPCMGMCHEGPNIRLIPNGTVFRTVSTKNLKNITEEIKSFIAC